MKKFLTTAIIAIFALGATAFTSCGKGDKGGGEEPSRPVITTHPVDVSGPVGRTVTLSITAKGAKSYQWQRYNDRGLDWDDIIDSNNYYSGTTTATLTITIGGQMDQFVYRCVATNDAGSANSTSATLTVEN